MADGFLLDTSIASIAWDGGNQNNAWVRAKLTALADEPLFVCAITLAEVEYGLQISSAMGAAQQQAIRDAMRQYQILPIDHHTSEPYGAIRSALFRLHSPQDKRGRLTAKRPEQLVDKTTALELGIQENDLWIVSVAAQYDLVLITQDMRIQRILDAAAKTSYPVRADFWMQPATGLGTQQTDS